MNDIKLHYFQKDLLKKLTLSDKPVRFNDLLIEGLESEHMNYHLQKLIEFGFVAKSTQRYSLTDLGKDYSNLMDDAIEIVEKQPKTSVLLIVISKRDGTNSDEYLVNKRLRQPYYGKVGMLTGKVRFGETLTQAAQRELFEESGLHAENCKLMSIYHKIRTKGDDTVQDVLFYRMLMTEISGELISKTQYQENFWQTNDELVARSDRYDTMQVKPLEEYHHSLLSFSEDIQEASDY